MSLPVRLCSWFHSENVLVMTSVEWLAILFGRESEADGCSLSVWKINANSGLPVPLQALHQSLSIFLQLIRKKKRERAILHRDAARLFYQELLLSAFTQCLSSLPGKPGTFILVIDWPDLQYVDIRDSTDMLKTLSYCWILQLHKTALSYSCMWKACVLRLMNSLYRRCRSDGVVKSCAL